MARYYVFCDEWLIEGYTKEESAKRLALKLCRYNEHGVGKITIYKAGKDQWLEAKPCFVGSLNSTRASPNERTASD